METLEVSRIRPHIEGIIRNACIFHTQTEITQKINGACAPGMAERFLKGISVHRIVLHAGHGRIILLVKSRRSRRQHAAVVFPDGFFQEVRISGLAVYLIFVKFKVRRGDLHSVEAGLTQDLDLTLAKKDKGEGITTEVKLSEEKLTAPVKKGVQVGTVTAYDKNHKKLAEAKLVTLESAKKGGILSYIGIADEDRGVFLVGLLIAVVLVILILLILRRMRRKKRARRIAYDTFS